MKIKSFILVLFTAFLTITVVYSIRFSTLNSDQNKILLRQIIQSDKHSMLMLIKNSDIANNSYGRCKAEYISSKGLESSAKREKLYQLIKHLDAIDSVTHQLFMELEQLKIRLIEESGTTQWPLKKSPDHNFSKKEWSFHNYELQNIQNPFQELDENAVFVSSNGILTNQGKTFNQRWNRFRGEFIHCLGSYKWFNNEFKTNVPDLGNNSDLKAVQKKLHHYLNSISTMNTMEDGHVIVETYLSLTLPENWFQTNFQNSTIIGAIAALTQLQTKIIDVRTIAFNHISSKSLMCGPMMNENIFTNGPDVISQTEEASFSVLFGAVDESLLPRLTVDQKNALVIPSFDGNNRIKIKKPLKLGKHTFSGTITVSDYSGVPKTEKWTKSIYVTP